MIYYKDNAFVESQSPHSLGLRNNMTIPNPGFDQNQLMINEKKFWGAGLQGLSFDGTGLFGTGLFSGDISTWGIGELIALGVGYYILYSLFYTTKSGAKAVHGATIGKVSEARSQAKMKALKRRKLEQELQEL